MCPRSIPGVPLSRALLGLPITAHHLCAFRLQLEGWLCGGITTSKKKEGSVIAARSSLGPVNLMSLHLEYGRPLVLGDCHRCFFEGVGYFATTQPALQVQRERTQMHCD